MIAYHASACPHDQYADDPAISACILCGVVVEYDFDRNPNDAFRPHLLIIEEEPW